MTLGEITGQLFTVTEFAAQFKLHPKTVARLCKYGRIPCIRIGKAYRFTPDNIAEYLRQARVRP